VMIRVTGTYGFEARRLKGLTGAWVGAEKIGAIGVRIQRWVTSHGFAFNANTDLEFFKLIVPCGISDRGVTSLQRLTGKPVAITEVQDRLVTAFCDVFQRTALV
jgi:lipoyl(octanoyl) transferase